MQHQEAKNGVLQQKELKKKKSSFIFKNTMIPLEPKTPQNYTLLAIPHKILPLLLSFQPTKTSANQSSILSGKQIEILNSLNSHLQPEEANKQWKNKWRDSATLQHGRR